MTTRLPILFLFMTGAIFHTSIFAQTIPDAVIVKTDSLTMDQLDIVADSVRQKNHSGLVSHFEAGLSYQSNDVYLGRKDSTVLPYYIPAFSYYDKSGLYATVSLNYLKNSTNSRIDLFTIEAGYMFSSGNYDGTFSASKYFYNSQSTSVTSEISAAFAYQNGYDLGFIKPSFTGTLNIGSKLDFSGLFGVEHTFYLFNDKLNLTPTFAATASTQNYYSDYYRKRRYTITRKGQPAQVGIANISGTVENASTFKLLDYEPTIPIIYVIGKCSINFSPTYSIPVNPATIDIQTVKENGNTIDHARVEKIENTFYWTLGITYSF